MKMESNRRVRQRFGGQRRNSNNIELQLRKKEEELRPAMTNLALGLNLKQPNYFRNPGARLAKALHQNRRGEADISTSQDTLVYAACYMDVDSVNKACTLRPA